MGIDQSVLFAGAGDMDFAVQIQFPYSLQDMDLADEIVYQCLGRRVPGSRDIALGSEVEDQIRLDLFQHEMDGVRVPQFAFDETDPIFHMFEQVHVASYAEGATYLYIPTEEQVVSQMTPGKSGYSRNQCSQWTTSLFRR